MLEATEKEKEDLVRSTEQRLKDMYGHKMKGVLTALEAFQEEFAGGGSGGSTSNASQSSRRSSPVSTDYGEMQCQFGKLRTVVVDAWDKAGDDCRPDIEARVAGLGEALQASFERWTVSTKEDLVLYAKVLLEKERWDGGTGGSAVQRSSRGLAMVMSRLRSDAEFLYESFAPCDEAWLQYAQSAAGVVVTLATEAAAMPGRQAAAAGSVAYRLNTLGMLAAQHDAFLSELLRAWNARHPLVKGTPTLDLTAVHERCSATLRTLSQSLSTTLASLVFAHAQRPLSLLYTVDMSYYKKYKNKDAYTKVWVAVLCGIRVAFRFFRTIQHPRTNTGEQALEASHRHDDHDCPGLASVCLSFALVSSATPHAHATPPQEGSGGGVADVGGAGNKRLPLRRHARRAARALRCLGGRASQRRRHALVPPRPSAGAGSRPGGGKALLRGVGAVAGHDLEGAGAHGGGGVDGDGAADGAADHGWRPVSAFRRPP